MSIVYTPFVESLFPFISFFFFSYVLCFKKKSTAWRSRKCDLALVILGATELINDLKSKGIQNNPKDDQALSLITGQALSSMCYVIDHIFNPPNETMSKN